jgi:DeoR family transcriptional regulator of aga operon
MFPEERRSIIIDTLNKQGRCLVNVLSKRMGVSEVTIRQDLDCLEREGLLRRTHGGAILPSKIGFERPFQAEETSFKTQKGRIAQAAAELISPGDTLILDVGTTVTELARKLLDHHDLTVFTNALNIAMILEANPKVTTIVTGGTLRAKQHSLVNPFATLILDKIKADIAFIGISGIEANHGITNVNIPEAELKSIFLKTAERKVVLADSSKVGNIGLVKIAEIEQIDLLITDKDADPQEIEALRQKGLKITLV